MLVNRRKVLLFDILVYLNQTTGKVIHISQENVKTAVPVLKQHQTGEIGKNAINRRLREAIKSRETNSMESRIQKLVEQNE